jgi:hypothetical protein
VTLYNITENIILVVLSILIIRFPDRTRKVELNVVIILYLICSSFHYECKLNLFLLFPRFELHNIFKGTVRSSQHTNIYFNCCMEVKRVKEVWGGGDDVYVLCTSETLGLQRDGFFGGLILFNT